MSDPHWDKVVLLVSFHGEDGATSAIDESPSQHSLTFSGHAKIVASPSKFGGGSLALDGNNDFVEIPDSDDWQIHATATDPFTVEGFLRLASSPLSTMGVIAQAQASNIANFGWQIRVLGSGTRLEFGWSTGTSFVSLIGDYEFEIGRWYHFAHDFDGTTLRSYVDGEVIASQTGLIPFINATVALRIGVCDSNAAFDFKGNLEEIRITKGVARYAGAFTPPSAPFPRGGGIVLEPTGLASTLAFGSHLQSLLTSASGFLDPDAFGAPLVGIPPILLSASGFTNVSAFGAPRQVLIVTPSGVLNATAFGDPTLIGSLVVLVPPGIPSEVAFGAPEVIQTLILLSPQGIAPTGGPGHPQVLVPRRVRTRYFTVTRTGRLVGRVRMETVWVPAS